MSALICADFGPAFVCFAFPLDSHVAAWGLFHTHLSLAILALEGCGHCIVVVGRDGEKRGECAQEGGDQGSARMDIRSADYSIKHLPSRSAERDAFPRYRAKPTQQRAHTRPGSGSPLFTTRLCFWARHALLLPASLSRTSSPPWPVRAGRGSGSQRERKHSGRSVCSPPPAWLRFAGLAVGCAALASCHPLLPAQTCSRSHAQHPRLVTCRPSARGKHRTDALATREAQVCRLRLQRAPFSSCCGRYVGVVVVAHVDKAVGPPRSSTFSSDSAGHTTSFTSNVSPRLADGASTT